MRTMTTVLLTLAGLALSAFALLCLFLYARQDSFLFPSVSNDESLAQQWLTRRVRIPTVDHWVEGWWADNPQARSRATVLYFGGNAEDVLFTAATAQKMGARKLLVTNYRGYGKTPGRPGQPALYADALAVYDYATTVAGVSPADIVVMGRSLGSGMATWLAAKRKVSATVLITPYDSIVNVAARHYAAFPVRTLLRSPFPSVEFAPQIHTPVLMLAAEKDVLIPPVHTRQLAAAWGGPHEVHVLAGMAHNNVEQHPDYYRLISEFLDRMNGG